MQTSLAFSHRPCRVQTSLHMVTRSANTRSSCLTSSMASRPTSLGTHQTTTTRARSWESSSAYALQSNNVHRQCADNFARPKRHHQRHSSESLRFLTRLSLSVHRSTNGESLVSAGEARLSTFLLRLAHASPPRHPATQLWSTRRTPLALLSHSPCFQARTSQKTTCKCIEARKADISSRYRSLALMTDRY